MSLLLKLIVMLGMLVVVPIGLRLIADDAVRLRRFWPVGALAGAASLWLPRGTGAMVLAAGYAVVAGLLAVRALVRLNRRRSLAPVEIAVLTAMVGPAIAASALVAERAGYRLFGFGMTTLSLTVAHFHFAGFAAALIAALVCTSAIDDTRARLAALCVPVGIGLVFLGFFVGDVVELAGAVVLTAGMWLVAWVTWRQVLPATPDRLTRWLLAVSAVILAGTMLLALDWALGHVVDVPYLPLEWMIATHGVANALGFALCGLLAWRRLAAQV
jgi:hypothetical protein